MTDEGKDGRGGAKQQQQQEEETQAELLLRNPSSCHPARLFGCVRVDIMRQSMRQSKDGATSEIRKSETWTTPDDAATFFFFCA